MSIIKDFIEMSGLLLDIRLWKARISYNKNLSKGELDNVIKDLKNLGITQDKIKVKTVEKIKKYGIRLYIGNSILAETIDNLNNEIKEYIIRNNEITIFKNYLQGIIAGDGNFFSNRDKNGSLHSRMYIYEEKEEYIIYHKKILESYGLNGKIKKDKNKNLYLLIISLNWNMLLKLLEYDLFNYAPHHKKRLIWSIKSHKKFRALKYLKEISKDFTAIELNDITKMGSSNSTHWIRNRVKEGLIEQFTQNNKKSWILTDEGKKIKDLINSLPSDF